MLVLPALFEILFEKDRAPGIGNQDAGSGQEDISGAILHFHTTTEKGGVPGHAVFSFGGA